MAFSQWVEVDTITGAEAIYQFKTMLVAAGWTVESSSDGTTYNPTGDEISHGGSGAGGMANNYAWFRISNLDGVEYCIQRVNISNLYYRVKCSPVAGFVLNQDGGASPPDATHTPYASDQGVLLGSGTDATPGGEAWFANDNLYRFKAGADSATPYHFWSTAFPLGGGTMSHFFAHEGLDACEPTDGAPFHSYIGGTDTNRGNLSAETESGNATRSWATVAAVTPATWTVMPAHYLTTASGYVCPSNCPVNPISGKDEAFPIPYARRSAISNPGWKGVGSMIRWTGLLRTTGDTLTVSTTRDRLVLYEVAVPWKGTVPTV